jgi:hypothetical protein
MNQDFPQQPYKPPTAYGAPNDPQGDSTGGVIPYKNAPALIAYYLGIFSLIPCLGLVFAIPALILGIIGLQKRKQNPAVKGSAHAWIGIVLGAICTLLWGGGIVFMVLASTVR